MRHVRPLAVAGVLAASLALPSVAWAHAQPVSSDPAAGESLDEAPTEVTVTFDGELEPESGFTVTDADGHEVGTGELDLDVAERNVLHGAVTITEPGVYTVTFTAISEDGHAEEGSFAFGFQATVTDAEHGEDDDHDDEGEPPDTAMASAAPASPLVVLGLLLLSGSAATAQCRLARRCAG